MRCAKRLAVTQGRALLFYSLAFNPLLTHADVDFVEFGGTLAQEWSFNSTRQATQKMETTFMPRFDMAWSNGSSLTGIARLRFDDASALGDYPNDAEAHAEIRELYLDTRWQDSFWRIGKQQVVWGQADGLRVLDVINPLDYREFILGSFEDRRLPLWMVNAELPVNDSWMAQLLWIPDQQYNELPTTGSEFFPTSPLVAPQLPSGLSQPPAIRASDPPDHWLRDSDVGLRLSAFVDGWDISFNYFYHTLDQAVLYQTTVAEAFTLQPEYKRSHLLGSSLSNVFGNTILRMEIGYSSEQYYLAQRGSTESTRGVHNSAELSYVLGLDWQPGSQWLLSAQLFQSTALDYDDTMFRKRTETQLSGLIQKGLLNESLNLRALLIHGVNLGDTSLQLEARYDYSTSLQWLLGIDIFDGTRSGLFGQFDAVDRINLGVSWSF